MKRILGMFAVLCLSSAALAQSVMIDGQPIDLTQHQVVVTVGTQATTPAPPVAPPPVLPPTGTALTACGDITKSGAYYLANDVSSAGTCLGIDADGITLNLNGHTITYDTGGAINSPAIEGHDCWSSNPVITGPCGSAHGGLEVYGGTIVQGASASSFSPVFEFGQGTFSSAPYIHDITARFQNTGAQFYFSRYVTPGARIENNTIFDNVTNIQQPGQTPLSARGLFQGQAIAIHHNRENPGAGDVISGNKLIGGPQGGVYSDNQHTAITGNDLSMNATYSNDFCAAMPADYQTFENNNCHPLSGRGVHINANHVTVSNNTISVIELKQNAEYSGCEGGGTYGVQLEFDTDAGSTTAPVGVAVTNNTITATSRDCQADGLRITSMTPAASANFTGNTITTTNNGTAIDIGISVDANNGTGVTFTGNTFSDMYAYADGEWDGYTANSVGHNTWLGAPKWTFVATDGGCDPSQTDAAKVCPASFSFTDALPSTVSCGFFSEATITIGGKITVCKAKN